MIKIERKDLGHRGIFEALSDGVLAGIMSYTMGDNKMIIDHTEVTEGFNGKGIGKELVFAGAEYARKERYKVIPLCPFANATFQKYPEIQDVLA